MGKKRSKPKPKTKTKTTTTLTTTEHPKSNHDDFQKEKDCCYPLPFPSHLPVPSNDFLTNEQPMYEKSFQAALETSYQGFAVDPSDQLLPYNINESTIQAALQVLHKQQWFRWDITQPFGLGTKCAKTYVTRCLVGNPGTTYKYLGLRMFAHSWNNNNSKGNDDTSSSSSSAAKVIGNLGQCLTKRSQCHQKQYKGGVRGRCDFDICLINRMQVSDDLKLEPNYQTSQTAVSWHADSSLEHYSTIAVYQTLLQQKQQQQQQQNSNNNDHPWYVALRVAHDSEGPQSSRRGMDIDSSIVKETPPIAVSLPSGSAYYMLDDFNHHHQHTVIARTKKRTKPPRKQQQQQTTATTTTIKSKKTKTKNGHSSKENNQDHHRHHQHEENVNTTDDSNHHDRNDDVIRYSCTYRLLRESHRVQDILARCQSAIQKFHKKGRKLWRSEQLLLTELESEWIRQFYIQGTQHYDLLWLDNWKEPMEQLLNYWTQLERRTKQTIDLLQAAAEGRCYCCDNNNDTTTGTTSLSSSLPSTKAERKAREKQKKACRTIQDLLHRAANNNSNNISSEEEDLFDTMAEMLEDRVKMRELWMKREKDHVFHNLPLDCRPMALPFQFHRPMMDPNIIVHKNNTGPVYGSSPLPGSPAELGQLAFRLRTYYKQAYASGLASDLPPPPPKEETNKQQDPALEAKPEETTTSKNNNNNNNNDAGDNTSHAKPMDWSGWGDAEKEYALEMQAPWAEAVVSGRKLVETRAYNLPPALLGKKIFILQSPAGTAGVSSVGNSIALQKNDNTKTDDASPTIIGWCRFTSVKTYTNRKMFEIDQQDHLVEPDSGYGWKQGKTKVIYGWVVGEYYSHDDGTTTTTATTTTINFTKAVRRMRSLFELVQEEEEEKTASGSLSSSQGKQRKKKKKRKSGPNRKNNNAPEENGGKRKKRRY